MKKEWKKYDIKEFNNLNPKGIYFVRSSKGEEHMVIIENGKFVTNVRESMRKSIKFEDIAEYSEISS